MDARCPLCTAVFQTERTGVQFCPNCGQQVNVADTTGAAPPPPPSGPGPGPQFFPPPAGAPPFTPPPPPGPGGREPTPWERRAELGFFTALFETWKQTMFSPTTFFERANPNGNVGAAILYGFLINVVAQLVNLPFRLAGLGRSPRQDLSAMSGEMREAFEKLQEFSEWFQQPKVIVGSLIAGIIFYPLAVLISSAIIHLFCLIWGASKNGYWATVRTVCYASSPLVFSISCIAILAVVYNIVLQIFGIWKMQQTTAGRAAGAVLSLFVLVFCCTCCGIAVMASSVASAAGGMK